MVSTGAAVSVLTVVSGAGVTTAGLSTFTAGVSEPSFFSPSVTASGETEASNSQNDEKLFHFGDFEFCEIFRQFIPVGEKGNRLFKVFQGG